jgi:hypothetical protein
LCFPSRDVTCLVAVAHAGGGATPHVVISPAMVGRDNNTLPEQATRLGKYGSLLEPISKKEGCRVNRCTRIVRARKFECFWLSVSY